MHFAHIKDRSLVSLSLTALGFRGSSIVYLKTALSSFPHAYRAALWRVQATICNSQHFRLWIEAVRQRALHSKSIKSALIGMSSSFFYNCHKILLAKYLCPNLCVVQLKCFQIILSKTMVGSRNFFRN